MAKGRMKFQVELSDGTIHEVTTGDADTIAAEDKFGIDATIWATSPKTEHFAYLVWHALKRRKVTDLKWEDFRDEVEIVDPVASEDAASGNA